MKHAGVIEQSNLNAIEMRSMLFVSLVCRSHKYLVFWKAHSRNRVHVCFKLGFESSVKVTGPCLQIKILSVKQNC